MMDGSNAIYYAPAFSKSQPGHIGRCRVMPKTVKTMKQLPGLLPSQSIQWKRDGSIMKREVGGITETRKFVLDSEKHLKPVEFFTPQPMAMFKHDHGDYSDTRFFLPSQVDDMIKIATHDVPLVVGTHTVVNAWNALEVIIHEVAPWHIRYSIQRYQTHDAFTKPGEVPRYRAGDAYKEQEHHNIYITQGTLDALSVRWADNSVQEIDYGWKKHTTYYYDDPIYNQIAMPGRWRPQSAPEGLEL